MTEANSPGQLEESVEATAMLYSALQALTIHSQENKTFTLYNFLLFNSLLLMGWATVFSQQRHWTDAVASCLLCAVGIGAAVAWRQLMADYARPSDLFRRHLAMAEKFLPARWPRPIAGRDMQIEGRDKEAGKSGVGDRDLLTWAPRMLAILYVALLLLSLAKRLLA